MTTLLQSKLNALLVELARDRMESLSATNVWVHPLSSARSIHKFRRTDDSYQLVQEALANYRKAAGIDRFLSAVVEKVMS